MRFFSCRAWTTDYKAKEIETFRAAKSAIDPICVEYIATEIYEILASTFGSLSGLVLTHPPRGHSRTQKHFIGEVCASFAERYGLEYRKIFKDRHLTHTSHPANYAERGEIEIESDLAGVSLLLVDDISTSRNTIEACAASIKAQGCNNLVIPVAWLYGDKKAE